jgi:hypothetical protein
MSTKRYPQHTAGTVWRLLSLFFLALVALPLTLSAQPPARGGGMGAGAGGQAMGENIRQMLVSPAARALALGDTLGITADQRTALMALERTWTETHGERIAALEATLESVLGQGAQGRNPEAMRQQRMQGGQAPLMGLMQEMAPLREGREAMMRDVAGILTATQFQELRTRLAPARPGGGGETPQMMRRQGASGGPAANRMGMGGAAEARTQQPQQRTRMQAMRGWMDRTDQRLRRLEFQGRQLQRQMRQHAEPAARQ